MNTDQNLLEMALRQFEKHSAALRNRSDRRALWMACVGVAACKIHTDRILKARNLTEKWMVEQPSRIRLFQDWIKLLASQENLETVLETNPQNQELRSICPLAASIKPKEHRAALNFFQKHLT
jgi:hypothetical protein